MYEFGIHFVNFLARRAQRVSLYMNYKFLSYISSGETVGVKTSNL